MLVNKILNIVLADFQFARLYLYTMLRDKHRINQKVLVAKNVMLNSAFRDCVTLVAVYYVSSYDIGIKYCLKKTF